MSNTIYTQILQVIPEDKNKFNYVYQITELSTGLRYIGSKGTGLKDPYKSLKKYQSSSTDKCFILSQKLNPLNYHYEILSYHKTRKEAYDEEARLHKLYDVKCNPRYINQINQIADGWSTAGKVTVNDKNGKTYFVNCDDPRFLSGELISIHKGKVSVKDKDGNTLSVDIDDPRYLSGELVHASKGKVTVKDKDGNNFMIELDDPRYKSGELVGVTKGLLTVKDKDGNKIQITSEEYKNQNELKIHTAGKVTVKDKNGNTLSVNVDDPRYLSGELVGIAKGKIAVKDIYGNRLMIYISDERYNVSLFPASSKIYIIEGKLYSSSMATSEFNITRYILKARAKSEEWKNWIEIKC